MTRLWLAIVVASVTMAACADGAESAAIAQLRKIWTDLTQALPPSLDTASARIDVLAAATVRHAEARCEALDSARRAREASTSAWDEARVAFARGNLKKAVQKAESASEQFGVVTASLEMSGPDAGK